MVGSIAAGFEPKRACYHRRRGMCEALSGLVRIVVQAKPATFTSGLTVPGIGLLALLAVSCVGTPTVVPVEPPSFDEKVSWILRLENQRVLRDSPDAAIVRDATAKAVPVSRDTAVPLRPEPDLVALLADPEPQLRRRAALAIGRVRLSEGVPPLISALSDPVMEVRQASAFALGLIGDVTAVPALVETLRDPEPMVQGRAAEALGRIGAVDASESIGVLVRSYVSAAFDLEPDDLSYPLSPEIESFRLGLYALSALGAYEPLAGAILQETGQPILFWWPVAYALQGTGDPRALDALITLASVQGSVGVAFAAQGLGALGGSEAADALIALLDLERRDTHVVASAIRALAQVDDPRVGEELYQFALTPELPPTLRLETIAALEQRPAAGSTAMFVELMTAPWPPMRGAALKALARNDPETFMLVLSGLGQDPDWRVRAARAEALAYVDPGPAAPQLVGLLDDDEPRVIPSVLRSLAALQVPDADLVGVLISRLASEDVVVRKTAATLLGEHGSRESGGVSDEITAALADAFESAWDDPAYLARAAIVDALAAVGGSTAQHVLDAALDDPDWAVRVRAAEGLRALQVDGEHQHAIRPAPGRRSVNFAAPHLVRPTVSPRVYVELDRGTIELELNVIDAPLTADNFMVLARSGFYDGLLFHRVVPNYVVQGGDPRGDGEGGAGYTLRDELNHLPFLRGTVGMALDWQDTGGSQFFITHSPQPHLDGRYTVFARVVAGMDVVDRIERHDTIRRVRVWDGVTPF